MFLERVLAMSAKNPDMVKLGDFCRKQIITRPRVPKFQASPNKSLDSQKRDSTPVKPKLDFQM